MAHLRLRRLPSVVGIIATLCALQPTLAIHAQDAQPVFKAGVALVPITALVRDSRNRIVRNLRSDDFQVLEGGRPRPIVDFSANEKAPINVAFLMDTSGSMNVASNLARAKDFVEEFVGGIEPMSDEVALFTFDKTLRREVSFTSDGDRVYDALYGVKPWGLTSLYDAIAQTAKQLGDRASQRRAVVVITDGVDTSSALTPAEVSGLASGIDVPVYVVAVVSPLDHPGAPTAVVSGNANGGLANVAEWTGGELLYVSESGQIPIVATELLRTMRHQYLLAIESSASAGWYQLEVKTKRRGLTVRARGGYFAGDQPRASLDVTDRPPN